jgi:purine-binding chemotaxis protein CheW
MHRECPGIDWDAVRGRLHEGSSASEQTAEGERSTLRQRADRLAVRADEATAATVRTLVFGLGEERYAVELARVAEVQPLGHCVRVPGAPEVVLGLMNRRGELCTVVGLARLLGLPEVPPLYAVVVAKDGHVIALAVDRLEGVRDIPADEHARAQSPATSRFVARVGQGLISILDAEALLTCVCLEGCS